MLQEVRKQIGWSRRAVVPYHFRTAVGREVDIVLEAPDGRIAGIEVKASGALAPGDFAGLQELEEASKDRFVRGVVLYLGENTLRFGTRLWALPVRTLWGSGLR